MQRIIRGQAVLLQFAEGEDLLAGLAETAAELGEYVITGGVGMLEAVELGYFDGNEYRRHALAEPHELLTLSGNAVAEPLVHCHATLAGPDFAVRGGHLFAARVKVTGEVSLTLLEGRTLRRAAPTGAGLRLLEI